MSHFNVLFVFGYFFSSWLLQRIPSDQYPLNPSVWLHWGQRPTLLSFSTGKALILFYPQARHLGCDWCRPASGPAALTFVWGEEPVGPGGNLLSVERIKDCTPSRVRPGKQRLLQVMEELPGAPFGQQQGPEGLPTLWTAGLLGLGNKVMFASSLPLERKWNSQIEGCMMFWCRHPSWES